MAVYGLLILSAAVDSIRDLWWKPDLTAVGGYMPYRAESRYGPWTALSTAPVPTERFRDQTTLLSHIYTVQPADWTDQGLYGYWAFRCPSAPLYGEVIDGRAIVASLPEHVSLLVDGLPVMAARVDGLDGTVWLPQTLMFQGNDDHPTPYVTLTPDSAVVVTYKTLANFVDPTPATRSHYTVVPLGANGAPLYAPGTAGDIVDIYEVDKMDWIQAEMVRKNAWEFEFNGEPAHLMIRASKGTPCGCVNDNVARTGCTSCYETGIVGGYYGPFDIFFQNPDTAVATEVSEGGKKVTRQSRSLLGPAPWIQAGDLIIRKNGERLVIANPDYISPKGVLLMQEFDVVLLPQGDTRYRIPLRAPVVPTVFDPALQASPGSQGEPVTAPRPLSDLTTPTPDWENAMVPVGRTVTFRTITT